MGSITPDATHMPDKMKAVVWEGQPYQMVVKEVEQPIIQLPTDVIIKVTTAAICGSDLHIYHGIGGASEPCWQMGHEAIGVVVKVGEEVLKIKVGQRVIVPDAISYLPSSKSGSGAYGFGNIIGEEYLGGCQAEYVRIPWADKYALPLPEGSNSSNDQDYVLLSDIFCTAWEAVTKSGFQAGDTVAVFGCGPVGLLGQYSALLRGASKVYAVDHVASRLEKAKSIGSIPIDLRKGDPAAQIMKLEPEGVNRSLDLCGYECVNPELKPQEDYIINQAIEVTMEGGGIGVIGVYIGTNPSPGSPLQSPKLSYINFNIGEFWTKGLSMAGGVVYPQKLMPVLMKLIESGRAKPGFAIDRVVTIDEVPEAYRAFSEQKVGKTLIRFEES